MAMASLHATLAPLLPAGLELSLHHVAHKPVRVEALYVAPPGQPSPPTTAETHFLAVSHSDVLVFAIEVLIYVSAFKNAATGKSHRETTLFVSKADSSGYLAPEAASFRGKGSATRESTLRTVTTAFIAHVVQQHRAAHPNIRKTTINLFARAQGQYLFPDSVSNPGKHVLDDRGLIRWWCRVLDPILQSYNSEACPDEKAAGYLLVPGLDKYQTAALLPPTTRQPTLHPDAKRWIQGHPLKIDPSRDWTVREVIPHFPDDPKARFLDELDSEYVAAAKGKARIAGSGWANVKTLDQFWEFMSFRQECSSGQSVGFIWLVIEKNKIQKPTTKPTEVDESNVASNSAPSNVGDPKESSAPSTSEPSEKQSSPPPPTKADKKAPTTSAIISTSANYKKILETLYCSDFGNLENAKLHSKKWIDGALTILGTKKSQEPNNITVYANGDWGEIVSGQKEVDDTNSAAASSSSSGVNVLTVRKKNKRGDRDDYADVSQSGNNTFSASDSVTPGVNVISGNLIRKKPKLDQPEPVQTTTTTTISGAPINVLSGSTIRKKPKSDQPPPPPAAPVAQPLPAAVMRKKPKPQLQESPAEKTVE
ncbi:histone acetylation protein-domain-containing protein [Peziza echinospora]|nr:histone acetylation protein-domain-containing protein [Peziza echinospora]